MRGTFRRLIYGFLAFIVFASVSCSPYARAAKSDDYGEKYKASQYYYNKGDFIRAQPLLENLVSLSRGGTEAQELLFQYAQTLYELKSYLLASFQFQLYAESYPASPKAMDADYMYAWILYKLSPTSNLDQSNTQGAIDALNEYLVKYPQSEKVEEVTGYLDGLYAKIEERAIAQALLYFKVGEYKAAVVSIANVLTEYPATKRREELELTAVRSAYLLSLNSIPSRRAERLAEAYTLASEFLLNHSTTIEKSEIEAYLTTLGNLLKSYSTTSN